MSIILNGSGTVAGIASGGLQDGAGPILGTAQASTSGTAIDFTGIPSWVKRITLFGYGVSTSGSAYPLLQLGTSGGYATSGYAGSNNGTTSTIGIPIPGNSAGDARTLSITLRNISGNTWVATGVMVRTDSASVYTCGGYVTLAGTLDRVRITTTDTFDAGSINIMYE